ncbi:neuraminidase-like domain-containing protein [Paenibacillus alvei]|uniref:Neuraminidase-like domain-containing protein n=1 Tax=Paenibacillus alvei TaxID=44250 RepID=A0ABT4H552_PAEAL|nr:neuraminidase-like domain-containing protein [Paenibacillus alvei]MCY7488079.1 neuraminidase-like domain-containing protein [Paenibacillus alvei]MCY9764115.1 neuraminidase-like domain-containing protein [Paenibacillus alvei]MCY9766970.1 neuraminidase-like domain-containing protein [Paenibacillus alvei]
MSTSTLMQSIKEARRDALVKHYIASQVPTELTDKITDADSLYEYLLLDTKISELVKTSPIAEAISSVQLYMNRCVEGYEGKLTPESNSHFAPGKFLNNWDTYNKRYSTWAGKERLKYYAGSYIDPSLRYNKTDPFLNLEQNISQGRITDDTVKNALQHYLTEYEVLADLEYISVNKGGDESVLLFVGRTKTMPYEYYWRRLTLKKDNNNKLVPAIWSGWKKITANIGEALDNYVLPFWENGRLHIKWITIDKKQGGDGQVDDAEYINDWFLNSAGVWCSYSKEKVFNSFEWLGYTLHGETSDEELNIKFSLNKMSIKTSYLNLTFTALSNSKINVRNDSPSYFINMVNIGNEEVKPGQNKDLSVASDKEYQVYVSADSLGKLTFYFSYLGEFVQQYGSINNSQYTPPSGSNIKGPIDLTLKNNIDLSALLDKSLDALFDYTIQGNNQLGGLAAFNGPYGLYLWEIFFHVPFLMAVRFHTEQRYELAERWFKFIFNSAGYRDGFGNLLTDGKGNVRYWNVMPLQEDTEWDDTLSLATTDPDEIAMADPMQYKLAIFIHTLDFLISRGDSLYRMLERDTLTEAKMYYIQASQLLGPRPEIRINHSWPNPTLQSEADAVTAVPTRSDSPAAPILAMRALVTAENGHFLPPYNDELFAFWDKIDLRLYNLRHNLSLDGQPLHLPLFAEPVNPRELQVQHGPGDGLGGSAGSAQSRQSVYRFPLVIDKARNAANSVIQFGNALENALTKQDSEAMTILLQSQQQIVLQQTRDIQEKNLAALQASLEATMTAKAGAESRKTHFAGLADNWMSDNETASLALRTTAGIINTSSTVPIAITGGLDMAPNIFGFAVGGSRWGAASAAVAQGLQIAAGVMEQTANIIDISESYRRRREDWLLQRDIAENEAAQLDSQIAALREQMDMARKQLALAETEQAHAQAVYELQSTRFTNQALYNWMAGRLSSLYYQMYDAALPLCLMAKQALEKEIGSDKTVGVLSLPAWNDLYQGLLAGEALLLELQKLENLWLEEDKRGMEAVKTVSIDTLLRKETPESSFVELVKEVLDGKTPDPVSGVGVQLQNNIFSATLDLTVLGLDRSYNQAEKTRRIKNLSVTLPALLGPYQDIEATLSLGGETVALSHGVDDSGLFTTDLNDSRFLPFEGMDPLSGTLVLSIFHAGQDGDQRLLLESLNDVIFHIRYVMK